MKGTLAFLFLLFGLSLGKVYFQEEFDDDTWKDRWIQSKHKSDYGEFKLTAGKFYGDSKINKGIQTSKDAKFYAISAKFDESFTNEKDTLVVQFAVKHEQNIDCGGGYLKLMSGDADLSDFHGETAYNIMFGPDICGPGTKKVHVIFTYKGKNLLTKKDIRCKDDEYTHVYTLIVTPDNKYEVLIDNEKTESGDLEADWDFLAPKKIKDPDAKKPDDWEDNEYMDDPEDKKPEDWEKPEHIPDPDAKKPEDWDDEMDGEWEPPQIDNPDYKGEWKPRQIKNENYKGAWVHPEIDNPEYSADDKLYLFKDIGAIGFDLWQVKAGTIFDNVFVGNDPAEAKKFAEDTWGKTKEEEKKMKEKMDEEDRKKMEKEEEERKAKEEDEKKDKDEEEEDEDEDEDKKEEEEKKEKEEEDEDKTKDEL